MKIISIFNNKGGVGKSTLGFHVGHALNEIGHKTLMIDLDPQCNLTIFGIETEQLHEIWSKEDRFIEDFETAIQNPEDILQNPRSIHFLMKPTEDGQSDFDDIPPPLQLHPNLDLIPGRLSIHRFENRIAERWSGAYQGDNLSIRTITVLRNICKRYAEKYGYEYILIDTSPSLGILNKMIISTVDGFFIPAQPDMFSLYGIRNIGNSLKVWQREFSTIYGLISSDKRQRFPDKFVQFLGFTIYNAKKYTSQNNEYDLAQAHYYYVQRIPAVIKEFIQESNREHLSDELLEKPIGGKSVMHTHNTYPSTAQALNTPMWNVPTVYKDLKRDNPERLTELDIEINFGIYSRYEATKENYVNFVTDLIQRIELL